MVLKSIIITVAIILASLSSNVLSAPPGYGIKSVTVRTTSGLSNTSIYANGRMQAAVNISYDLAEGYTVSNVSVLEAYTERELPNHWSVSYSSNGYVHDMNNVHHVNPRRLPGSLGERTTTRFLSTKVVDDRTICAEVTATNGISTSKLSTCSGNTNNGLVHINTNPARNYSISDFEQVVEFNSWWDSNHQASSPWGLYGVTYTKLTPKPGLGINIKSIDAGTSIQDDAGRIMVGSKLPKDKKDSAFYVLYPNKGSLTTYYNYSDGNSWRSTKTFTTNTNNAIVFASIRGTQNKSSKFYANVLMNWEMLMSHIKFYDVYGNEGYIHIAREDKNDGYGPMYYKLY